MCLMSKEKPSRSRKRPLSQEEYLLPNRVVTTKRRATDHNVHTRRDTRTAHHGTSTVPRMYVGASTYERAPILHGHGVRRAPPQPCERRPARTHARQPEPAPAPKAPHPNRERANTRKKRAPGPIATSTQRIPNPTAQATTHHQHSRRTHRAVPAGESNFAGRAASNTALESVRRDAFRQSHGRLRRVAAVDLANVRAPLAWDYAHSQHQAHHAPYSAPVVAWA